MEGYTGLSLDIPKLGEMLESLLPLERRSYYFHFGKKMVMQIYGYNC